MNNYRWEPLGRVLLEIKLYKGYSASIPTPPFRVVRAIKIIRSVRNHKPCIMTAIYNKDGFIASVPSLVRHLEPTYWEVDGRIAIMPR